jgi:hypothetical protein
MWSLGLETTERGRGVVSVLEFQLALTIVSFEFDRSPHG